MPTKIHTIPCDCGVELPVDLSQAGSRLSCPQCGLPVVVPPLSTLQGEAADADLRPLRRDRLRLRFSLRTLLLTVMGFAVLMAVIMTVQNRYQRSHIALIPIDRSWCSGSVRVEAKGANSGKTTEVVLTGSWPDASPSLQMRYRIWCVGAEGKHRPLAARTWRDLSQFTSARVLYEGPQPLATSPFRVVCDYEIWDGEPGRGVLLGKNSVFSEPYGNARD